MFWNFLEFSKNCLEFFWIFWKNVWIFFATATERRGAERPRRHSKKAPTSTFLGSKQRQKVARVATSGDEIDQNSEKRFFWFSKISRFSSRAKRAHGREAPRKTQTRGSERSTETRQAPNFVNLFANIFKIFTAREARGKTQPNNGAFDRKAIETARSPISAKSLRVLEG